MPTEERSLGDETPPASETPASPFGTPTRPQRRCRPDRDPDGLDHRHHPPARRLLSGDVRRAEKTARFCSKPWLEADIDELLFELDQLTDSQGNPLPAGEPRSASRPAPPAGRAGDPDLQAEYGAAFVSVRMGQLPSDDWQEFKAKWREVLDKGAPYPNEFYDDLIEVSAKTPKITAAQAAQLRTKLGDPQMDVLAKAAWEVNTNSGVSIPKSPLSSHVLRQAARAQS
jgi:hypothetical protein